MKSKIRFKVPDKQFPHCAEVYAKRKGGAQWEKIGVCHAASIPILKESMARFDELVKITIKL